MGESADELKQRVDAARSRLEQDINSLEYQVKRTTDWRVQFDQHPWTFLGAALAAGLMVGVLFGHREQPQQGCY